MKKYLFFILTCVAAVACSKDDEDPVFNVKYEVLTSGEWFGEYIIETGEKICRCGPPLFPGGWTYTFTVKEKPFELHIDATTDCICMGQEGAPDVTTNIYVNDELVSSNTSNWAPGVASADFVIQ